MVRNLNYWEISDEMCLTDFDANMPDLKNLPIPQAKSSKVPYVIQLLTVLHQNDQKDGRSLLSKLQSFTLLSENQNQTETGIQDPVCPKRFSLPDLKKDRKSND